jgi:hypothetical protein
MIADRVKSVIRLAAVAGAIAMLTGIPAAHAATYTGPIKEILHSGIGWEVNKQTKQDFCLFESKECQQAKVSAELGGFEYVKGIAVAVDKGDLAHYGHLYVTDTTARVQEFEANGAFVRMFGWDVNKTKVKAGGADTQAEKNVCTEQEIKSSGVECQPGVPGPEPGQFGEAQNSIAVDPASGDVYVVDSVKATNGERVQEFTANGEWVLEIGRHVNETTGENVCTEEEVKTKGVKCTAPAPYQGAEPGAFEGEPALAVGGAEDLLYVGAGQLVQKFEADGTYKSQISLAGTVAEMALDDSCRLQELTEPACASFDSSYGDLYVVYKGATTVHELKPNGEQLAEWLVQPRAAKPEFFFLKALAVDPSGRVAVGERETVREGLIQTATAFGSLLKGATGELISEFAFPASEVQEGDKVKCSGCAELNGLSFSAGGELYGAGTAEVLGYEPVHVAELVMGSAACLAGPDSGTDATFSCTFHGELNPEEVPETQAWFQYGISEALGLETLKQTICGVPGAGGAGEAPCGITPIAVEATVQGRRPNQTVDYRLASEDANAKGSERLSSRPPFGEVKTETVPPRIVGEPSAPFVRSSSAVLYGQVNPENAPSEYFFEYGTALAGYCEGALRTKTLESAVYGKVGATLEVTGLQPAITYRYRLCAANAAGNARDEHGGSEIEEGAFTTAPAPVPQATTGPPSAITATGAIVSGFVNPDGQPATYAFELGVYEGAATQYVVVFSGPAGGGTAPVEESLVLTGLQPGTEYAYRIKVSSGYGTDRGVTERFTTLGLPSVLPPPTVLAQLPVPSIKFPELVVVKPLTNAQKLANALKVCKKKPRKQRASCERSARKKYGAKPKKKK